MTNLRARLVDVGFDPVAEFLAYQEHYTALRRALAALEQQMRAQVRGQRRDVYWAEKLAAILAQYPAP